MPPKYFDKNLIKLLLGDGRASLRTLAEELDVSVTTVSNWLEELEDAGVIDGFTPKLNYDMLGYDLTAFLQISTTGDDLLEVLADLEGHDQFTNLYTLNDGCTIVAVGKFRHISEMNTCIKSIQSNNQICGVNSSIVIDTVIEGRDIIDSETSVGETVSMNDTEQGLLTEIKQEFELPDETTDIK